jgi:uncharacterized protein YndB with AHSA1/START domain
VTRGGAIRLELVSEPVSVSRDISASPDKLWAMVADVARMGEWSPENEGGEWLGDATAAKPGARFRATNRVGKKSWKTVATVVDAEPARRFSFRVSAGPVKVSEWSYTFETTTNGCRVTESWTDLRPGWFKPLARLATGVGDRVTHNRQGMEQTLERLAAVAESQP